MRPIPLLVLLAYLLLPTACLGLSIGTVEDPPGNFTDANGRITGLSVDFVREIQKRVNNHDPIRMLPGARLIYLSLSSKNFVIFSLSRTPEREEKYHWISLVMRKPLALFGKKRVRYQDDGTFDQLAEKWATYTQNIVGVPCEVKNGALQFWED